MAGPGEILDFWFAPENTEKWFQPSADFDAEIARRFAKLHKETAANAPTDWEASPEGALALVILLDQFPRNLFRDSPRAFATDALALAVADRAIERGFDLALPIERRVFLYLPFEHSENIEYQHRCCSLTAKHCDIGNYFDYAKRHRAVIARFGRFPHRNAVLGRKSTPDEIAFLAGRDEPF